MSDPELNAQAERAIRRGDMAEAIRIYEQAVAEDPSDAHAAQKLARLKESLQPMELMNPKARAPVVPAKLSPEQEGERLFNQGDYAGAAKAYREALRAKPDSPLIQERLMEIIRMAQSAESPGAEPQVKRPSPEATLEELLQRITRRRRT